MAGQKSSWLRKRMVKTGIITKETWNAFITDLENYLTFNDSPTVKVDGSSGTGMRFHAVTHERKRGDCQFEVLQVGEKIYIATGWVHLSTKKGDPLYAYVPKLFGTEREGALCDMPPPYELIANLGNGRWEVLLYAGKQEGIIQILSADVPRPANETKGIVISIAEFTISDGVIIDDQTDKEKAFQQKVCGQIDLCCDSKDTSSSSSLDSGGTPPYSDSSSDSSGSDSSGVDSTPSDSSGGQPTYDLMIRCTPDGSGEPEYIPIPIPPSPDGKYRYYSLCVGGMNGSQTFGLNLEAETDCPDSTPSDSDSTPSDSTPSDSTPSDSVTSSCTPPNCIKVTYPLPDNSGTESECLYLDQFGRYGFGGGSPLVFRWSETFQVWQLVDGIDVVSTGSTDPCDPSGSYEFGSEPWEIFSITLDCDCSSSDSAPSDSSSYDSTLSDSSCECDYVIGVDLNADDSFDVSVTNFSDCDLVINSMSYANNGNGQLELGWPTTVAANGVFAFTVTEIFDVRGLIVDVSTSCGDSQFTIPIA